MSEDEKIVREAFRHVKAMCSYAIFTGWHPENGITKNVEDHASEALAALSRLIARADRLSALLRRMVEAGEPFAVKAKWLQPTWLDHEEQWPNNVPGQYNITVGDLRAIRAASEAAKKEMGE
jgi:hypothetical protein